VWLDYAGGVKMEEDIRDTIRVLIREEFDSMFDTMLWELKNHIDTSIRDEITHAMGEEHIRDIIRHSLKYEIESSRVEEIIKAVIEKIVTRMNKTLQNQLQITKTLCYSIDAEIKHTMINAPIGYSSEQKIVERIERLLQTKQGMKSIEHKEELE
jgi:hypothetical protein